MYRERKISLLVVLSKLIPKVLGMQSNVRSPRARRRALRCVTPHHGSLRCSSNREYPEKARVVTPRLGQDSSHRASRRYFKFCHKAYAEASRPCVRPKTQFGNSSTPIRSQGWMFTNGFNTINNDFQN